MLDSETYKPIIDKTNENILNSYELFQFDHILRKVIKICKKDSTENFNEETIDKIWLFTLDQFIEIRAHLMAILTDLGHIQLAETVKSYLSLRIDFVIE